MVQHYRAILGLVFDQRLETVTSPYQPRSSPNSVPAVPPSPQYAPNPNNVLHVRDQTKDPDSRAGLMELADRHSVNQRTPLNFCRGSCQCSTCGKPDHKLSPVEDTWPLRLIIILIRRQESNTLNLTSLLQSLCFRVKTRYVGGETQKCPERISGLCTIDTDSDPPSKRDIIA